MSPRTQRPDVVVVGGGIIGCAVAWRAAQRGLAVTVVDPAPGSGASDVAAGMLAPVTEAHWGEEDLLRLNVASARQWPAFAAELQEASAQPIGFGTNGTLLVAYDADDRAALDEVHAFQRRLGLEVERLTGREARRLEPLLVPSTRSALFAPGDQRVDPRAATAALMAAAQRAAVAFQPARAEELRLDAAGERAAGVRFNDGTELDAGAVVLAAGWATGQLSGVPDGVLPSIRPVKGQILTLRQHPDEPVVGRSVRGLVRGSPVYLVPRHDGRVIVGATVEELGCDTSVTAGGVYELLRDAALLVPAVTELALVETRAGLRPATPDNAPAIGATDLDGLLVATGHYRNGVLLTPVTADAVAAVLAGEQPSVDLAPFAPGRFGAVPAGAR